MRQNAYVRQVLMRQNLLRNKILDFFLGLASYPRLLLEVFVRKNFGIRYFTLATVICIAVMLIIIPCLGSIGTLFSRYGRVNSSEFLYHYASWYLFILCFLVCAYKRWREIKNNLSTYDLARISTFSGEINLSLFNFPRYNWYPNIKVIETLYEPLLFFLIGLVLNYFDQHVGWLLIISSIFYSLGYIGAYKRGDDFIMDKLDEMLVNANLKDVILNGKPPEQAGGLRIYAKRPASPDIREQLLQHIMEEDEEETVFAE